MMANGSFLIWYVLLPLYHALSLSFIPDAFDELVVMVIEEWKEAMRDIH
jgi:hypothetical protein